MSVSGPVIPPPQPVFLDNFLAEIQGIHDKLTRVDEILVSLGQAQEKVIGPSLVPLSEAHRQSWLNVIDRNREQLRDLLREIGNCIRATERHAGSFTSIDQRTLVASQLALVAKKYKEAALAFSQREEDYRQRVRARITRQARIVNPHLSAEDLARDLDHMEAQSGHAQAYEMNVFKDPTAVRAAQTALQESQERQRELVMIQHQTEQVAQMFADVALMVDNQDARLNEIFNAADHAAENLEKGTAQVNKAIKTRRRNIKCYCILLAVFLVALTGALLYFFYLTQKGQEFIGRLTPPVAPPQPPQIQVPQ